MESVRKRSTSVGEEGMVTVWLVPTLRSVKVCIWMISCSLVSGAPPLSSRDDLCVVHGAF